MPRYYKPLPELWEAEIYVRLSDKYPTGLEWAMSDGWRKEGEQAGKLYKGDRFYCLDINRERWMAHRIVYMLRTRENPGNHDIFHAADNTEKDNRKTLYLVSDLDNVPPEVAKTAGSKRVGGDRERKRRKKEAGQCAA